MAYFKPERRQPQCYKCDVVFKSWKDLYEHRAVIHDRYNSVDMQRQSWVKSNKGSIEENQTEEDYWICQEHLRKLTDDFKCPISTCENNILVKKSIYLKEIKERH